MAQHTELLDHHFLRENYLEAGFRNLLIEVLSLFVQQTDAYLAAIQEALSRRDTITAAEQAHALKGSAGSVGARAICELAQRLEDGAAAGDLTSSIQLAAGLAQSVTLTKRAIAAELEQLSREEDADFFS